QTFFHTAGGQHHHRQAVSEKVLLDLSLSSITSYLSQRETAQCFAAERSTRSVSKDSIGRLPRSPTRIRFTFIIDNRESRGIQSQRALRYVLNSHRENHDRRLCVRNFE